MVFVLLCKKSRETSGSNGNRNFHAGKEESIIYFISFPRVLASPQPWVGPVAGNSGGVGKEEVGNVLGRAVSLPCGTPPAPHPCPIPRFLDVGAGAIYRILIINIIDT